MTGISAEQEQQLKDLVSKGNKIAAIALYREMSGVSLKEAKDRVEAILVHAPVNFSGSVQGQPGKPDLFLENRIKRLLSERKKIEAVKVYREANRCGLKEAKDAVDLIQAEVRKSGNSNSLNAPATSDDPFAEDAQENRMRLVIFIALLLGTMGGLALFFILQSGS